jgi:single stranded DNA-binding protein
VYRVSQNPLAAKIGEEGGYMSAYIVITGRVGRDPEIRAGDAGESAYFTVAVNRRTRGRDGSSTEETDWYGVRVRAPHTVRYCSQYLRKGNRVAVSGLLGLSGGRATINAFSVEKLGGEAPAVRSSGHENARGRGSESFSDDERYDAVEDFQHDEESLPF